MQIQRLTGDCALASAFVSYLGPFNKEFRELLLHRDFYGDCMKLNVPVTPHLQITKFLVDDSEVGEWNLQGLPTDELSIQNGIMVTRASRYPVLVDPQVGKGKEGCGLRVWGQYQPRACKVGFCSSCGLLTHTRLLTLVSCRAKAASGSRTARRRTSSRPRS